MAINPHTHFADLQSIKKRYNNIKEIIASQPHHPIVETWLVASHACIELADQSVKTLQKGTNLREKDTEFHVNRINELSRACNALLGLVSSANANHDAILRALEIDISDD